MSEAVVKKKQLDQNIVGLEHDKLSLGAIVGQFKLENKDLDIQLKGVEKDTIEKDRIVVVKFYVVEGIEWVLKAGLSVVNYEHLI